jgi:hypothetical protein
MPIKLNFREERVIIDVNFLLIDAFLELKKFYGKDKKKLDKAFYYIYFMYSLDEDNIFRDLDSRVKTEQVIYKVWGKKETASP